MAISDDTFQLWHYDYIIRVSFIIVIIKKDRQCKAGRGRLTPYQSEDPSPSLPNQPHLLSKNQINMGFSHFHEFGILSGIYKLLAPYQIDIVNGCGFCNGNIILIWYWFFLPTYHDFERWKQHLFDILIFTRLCQGIDNCSMLSVIHEILQNSNPFTSQAHQLNKVTKGNKSLNWLRNFFLYFK